MSTIKVNSIEPANAGSEDYFLARAWVNFDGTGTVAIRADGNVTSITDNGAGDYTLNFATAMSDANYSAVMGVGNGTSSLGNIHIAQHTTLPVASALRIATTNGGSTTKADRPYVWVATLR